jgi:hypothetical protein
MFYFGWACSASRSPSVRFGFRDSASQNRTPNLTSHINTGVNSSSSVFPGHALTIIVEHAVSKSAANPTLSLNYVCSYAKLRRIWRDDFDR